MGFNRFLKQRCGRFFGGSESGPGSTVPRRNDRDFEARIVAFLEFLRGIKSTETATENKHACLVTHNLESDCAA